jgi:1,2-diacylglycerol 3-alpha-glucosyltransferase
VRIGIVSKWFPSGQGVVSRHLRSALDELGHETFVLARPGRGPRGRRRGGGIERIDPAWHAPGVHEASAPEPPADEYLSWAAELSLDAIFCDENYQFEELSALRERGVLCIGRFVWESFSPADVEGALRGFDTIYSLTRCEQARYRELGIDSPYVRWGIHPELLEAGEVVRSDSDEAASDIVRYFFPASFLGPRRPVRELLRAFRMAHDESLRLLISAQLPRRAAQLERVAGRDSRIELLLEELPTDEYLRAFGQADVCVAPSRWEGLGVPLYEATALGLPIITNDAPPMNELVADDLNGLLVASRPNGTTKSGIPAHDPDVAELTRAIERLADPDLRDRLSAGARRVRAARDWSHTITDLSSLLEGSSRVGA